MVVYSPWSFICGGFTLKTSSQASVVIFQEASTPNRVDLTLN